MILPSGYIIIDTGVSCVKENTVTLFLSGFDTGSGLLSVVISNSPDFSVANTITLNMGSFETDVYPWFLTCEEGTRTVYVEFIDAAGNTLVYTDTIVLDSSPPTGSIFIDNNSYYANTVTVNLSILAVDSFTPVDSVVISNFSNFSVAETYSFSSVLFWVLTEDTGVKGVYVKFIDAAGNVSPVYSDTVILIYITNVDIVSNGMGGGLWSDTNTWNGGAVPISTSRVGIYSNDTVIFDRSEGQLIYNPGLQLTISCKDITIYGTLTFQADTGPLCMQINGNMNIHGNLIMKSNAPTDSYKIAMGSLYYGEEYRITVNDGGNLQIIGYGAENKNCWISGTIAGYGDILAKKGSAFDCKFANFTGLWSRESPNPGILISSINGSARIESCSIQCIVSLESSSNIILYGNTITRCVVLKDSAYNTITINSFKGFVSYGSPIFTGISLNNSSYNFLSNNSFSNYVNGIEINQSSHNLIIQNTFRENTSGFYLLNSSENTITMNNCNFNDFGIFLSDSHNNYFVSNSCNENAYDGIYLINSSGNVFVSNTCNSNTDIGIFLDNSHNNSFNNNICNFNSLGIELDKGSSENILNGNTCNNNQEGISLIQSMSNFFSNNTCSYNAYGIYINPTSFFNTFTYSICNYNNVNGACIEGHYNSFLCGNYSYNKWNGIYLYCASNNIFSSNVCDANDMFGIWARGQGSYTAKNNIFSSNICRFNSEGIYLVLCQENTIVSNICNSNKVGINLNDAGNNFFASNQLSSNSGYGLTSISTLQNDINVCMNELYSNNLLADIFGYWRTKLILRNCIFSSSTEVDASGFSTGGYILSQNHGQIPGLTKIWGDYTVPAGETLYLNYAKESYFGAGDTNIQKIVRFLPTPVGTKLKNAGAVEITGTPTIPTIISKDGGESYGFTVNGISSNSAVINAKYFKFYNLNLDGVKIGPYVHITNLDSGSFTEVAKGGIHLWIDTISDTFDNITFDDRGAYNVKVTNGAELIFRDYNKGLNPDTIVSGTIIWDPTLDWCGTEGFTSDGVESNRDANGSTFTFCVEYTDLGVIPEGDTPIIKQVWIDLNNNGQYSGEEKFDMHPEPNSDGIYSNGETYTFSKTIFYSGATTWKYLIYKFYFGNEKSKVGGQPYAFGMPSLNNTFTLTIEDTTLPVGSILINTGAFYTNKSTVTLSLTAIETISYVDSMVLSNHPDFSIANTYSFTTSMSWILTPEIGVKTVYVKYIDAARNISVPYSDTIILIWMPGIDIVSNGIGGGLWSDTKTWAEGIVPISTTRVGILSPDTVVFDRNDGQLVFNPSPQLTTTCRDLTIYGTLVFQTNAGARTMQVNGNINIYGNFIMKSVIPSDNLRLRLGWLYPTGRHCEINVNDGGKLKISGYNAANKNCWIVGSMADYSYINAKEGSNFECKFANFTGLLSEESPQSGILISSVDRGAKIESCSIQCVISLESSSNIILSGNTITRCIFIKNSSGNTLTANYFKGYDYYGRPIYTGISLNNSFYNLISNNFFESCVNGVEVNQSANNLITQNIFRSNTAGICLNNSNENVIKQNDCSFNDFGIFLQDSDNNTLFSNLCNNNGYDGIYLSVSENNIFTSNNCNSNTDIGIFLDNSYNNYFNFNTCRFNNLGIHLDNESSGNLFERNTCNNNLEGISVERSSSNIFSINTCTYNSNCGIFVGADSYFNTFTYNICNYNDIAGLRIEGYNNSFKNGSCSYNGYIGIYLYCALNNLFSSNVCESNDMCGIWARGQGSNTAKNNIFSSNICRFNSEGIYLVLCQENTIVSNICNSNKVGINLNDAGNNFFASNQLSSNSGYGLTSISTLQNDINVCMNELYSNNLLADIFGYWRTKLILRNCIFSSSTEVDASGFSTGGYILSQNHGQIPGLTKIWGDYTVPAGETLYLNYAKESYFGAGDTNIQKIVRFLPTPVGTKLKNAGAVEITGTPTIPTIISKDGGESYGFTVNGISSNSAVINAKYFKFYNLNLDGVKIGPYVHITNLDSGSFTEVAKGGIHLWIDTISDTFDNITFDDRGAYNVKVTNGAELIFRDYNKGLNPDTIVSGTIIWDPTLDWCGTEGFTSDGVESNRDANGSTFTFCVEYTDLGVIPEGDTPIIKQVWIDLNNNGQYSGEEKFDMHPEPNSDGIYSNGETYTFSKTIFYSGATTWKYLIYKFYFGNEKSKVGGQPYAFGMPSLNNTFTLTIEDTTLPVGSILINTGAFYTNKSTVTLSLTAIETISYVDSMVLSNHPDFSIANTYSFTTSMSWILTPEIGVKTVYVKYIDAARNISVPYSDTIILIWMPGIDIVSNGIGGGLWSDTKTWAEGIVPISTTRVGILSPDTVVFDRNDGQLVFNPSPQLTTTCRDLTIYGTLVFQTNAGARTMQVNGNINIYGNFIMKSVIPSDNLRLRLGWLYPTGRHCEINVNDGGKLKISGYNAANKNCWIVGSMADYSYINAKEGSNFECKFANFTGLLSEESPQSGILISSVDRGAKIESCSIQCVISLESSSNIILSGNTITRCIFIKNSSGNTLTANYFKGYDYYGRPIYTGISLNNSFYNLISNNFFESCVNGVEVNQSANNLITQNIFRSNTAGICLNNSNENVIKQNDCSFNDFGIFLQDSDNNTLFSNLCNNNGYDGIYLSVSENNIFTSNNCNSNTDIGIFLDNSYNNYFNFNTCRFNNLGIHLDNESSGNLFERNTCNNNLEGISVERSSSNIFSINTCTYNSNCGIFVGADSYFNTFTYNICNYNDIAGLRIEGYNNSFKNGSCSYNGYIGIYLYCALNNLFSSNVCESNDMCGIWARGQGSNTAKNNIFSSNICRFNSEGIYLVLCQENTIVSNICNSNGVGINLNDAGNNFFASNQLSSNSGYGLTSISTLQNNINVCMNELYSNNLLADIFGYWRTKLILRNCILSSSTEVNTSGFSTGGYILSQNHDRIPGLTRIWGDYTVPAGETFSLCYEKESYPGAGDLNVQKVVKFYPTSAVTKFSSAGTIEIVGTTDTPVVISKGCVDSYSFRVNGTTLSPAAINAKYFEFHNLNPNGLVIGPYAEIINLDNGIFREGAKEGVYLWVDAVTDTIDNCIFDDSTSYNVKVTNGASLTFRDYNKGLNPDTVVSGTIVWDPTLNWCGAEGFESDGVEPNIGCNTFTFCVKYTDRGVASGGDSPTIKQVWIDLNNDKIYSDTEKFDMGLDLNSDGIFSNGETYIYTTVIPPEEQEKYLNYRFYFGNQNSKINGMPFATGDSGLDNTFTVKDIVPPKTLLSISNPKHISLNYVYVRKITPFNFIAIDTGSGVSQTAYRIDNNQWKIFSETFTFSRENIIVEGLHTIFYYSIDKVGNLEMINSFTLLLDDSPPSVELNFSSPFYLAGTNTYITSSTQISLVYSDLNGCGVETVEYRIDTGPWVPYTAPFNFPQEGEYSIFYRAIDWLGNTTEAIGKDIDEHTVALWRMYEEAGSLVFDSIGDNTGTAYGTTIVDGMYNKARSFNGLSDYINCGDSPSLAPPSFTLSAWVYPTDVSGIQPIIFRGIDGGDANLVSYAMAISEGQYCVVVFTNDVPGPQGWVGSVTANQWHNLAFTYDGATGWGYGYIDGESYALPLFNPSIGIPRPDSWNFQIGMLYDHSIDYRYFNGIIGEVSVSDVARTQEEIRASVNSYRAGPKFMAVKVDNTPPKSSIRIGMPNYSSGGNTYVTLATPLIINAVDTIGLDSPVFSYCRIDTGSFRLESETFTLFDCGVKQEGTHTIYYYSSDCVGNAEGVNSFTAIVDNSAPVLSISCNPFGIPIKLINIYSNEPLKTAPEVRVVQNGGYESIVPMTFIAFSGNRYIWHGNYDTRFVIGYNGWAAIYVKGEDMLGFAGTVKNENAFNVSNNTPAISIDNIGDTPDPFAPPEQNVSIFYSLRCSVSTSTLEIFNDIGARVRKVEFPWQQSLQGNHSAVWNGADQSGKIVWEGIYTYKLTALWIGMPLSIPKYGQVTVLKMAQVDTTDSQMFNPSNAQINITPYSPSHPAVSDASFAIKTQGLVPMSSIYDINPDGAIFDTPALLTIRYNEADVVGFEEQLKIYEYNESAGTWEAVPDQELDTLNNCIRVHITHLSLFSMLVSKSALQITPPFADIISPASNSIIGPSIEIRGTAVAQMFDNYRFEYGQGEIPDTWILIEPVYGYPVDSGVLHTWNTTDLEGICTLRLTVTNMIGDTASAQVTVIIDNTKPTTTTLTIGEPKYDYGNGTPLVVTSHTPFIFSSLDTGAVQSGIAWVECSVDNDTSWAAIPQTGEDTLTGARIFTFTIPDTYPDAEHIVYYRSVDSVGNYEDSHSITIILDNTSPVAALIYPSKQDIGICKVVNSNTASIIGTTTDIHFSLYRIELKAMRDGDTPTDWTSINEAELQKETQSFGVWNTTQFTKNRWYYIRIVSTDKVNNTSIDTVSVYLGNPEVKLVFGDRGNDNGEFKEPYGIAFSPTQTGSDNSGCIFVTDNKNDRVQKFDLNGNFLLSFNGRSEESHKLKKPSGIAVTTVVSGEWSADTRPMVFVADRDNDRIQAFDLFGNFLFSFGERYDIKRPEQLSVGLYYTYSDTSYTCTKAVYVADAKKDRIAIFDYEGNMLSTISNLDDPQGVFALNHLQYPGPTQASVYIANTDDNIVTVYTSALTPTLSIRGLDDPRAVYADPPQSSGGQASGGYIYVSDSGHNAVKRYNRYGELLMQWTGACTTSLDKPTGICLDNQGNLWIADEENDRIVKIGAPTVDETMAMRMFSLPKAAMTIKDAYAYPIPYKPNSGLGHTAINFKLYSTNVLLMIYNIAGELIFEQASITTDPYIWAVVNNWNEPVVSGVYIYFLTDDTKEKKLGKIVIIK